MNSHKRQVESRLILTTEVSYAPHLDLNPDYICEPPNMLYAQAQLVDDMLFHTLDDMGTFQLVSYMQSYKPTMHRLGKHSSLYGSD